MFFLSPNKEIPTEEVRKRKEFTDSFNFSQNDSQSFVDESTSQSDGNDDSHNKQKEKNSSRQSKRRKEESSSFLRFFGFGSKSPEDSSESDENDDIDEGNIQNKKIKADK